MRALTKRILSGANGLAQAPRNCHFHFPLTMKSNRLVPALAAALVCTVPHAAFSQQSGVQSLAEQQIRQQEQMAVYAQQAVDKGNVAMANQDYESAYAWFKSAVDVLPSGGEATAKVRVSALDGFSKACVKLAEQRISEGRYQDAETVVTVILDERYNPNYKPALVLQKNLATQGRYNKSITPGFVASVEEVKQLLTEADGFYGSGRFDLATKRYEQVLNIDKYNIAARRGMERVDLARQQYQDSATSEARSDMIRQVDKGWELPVRKFDVGATSIIDQPPVDTRGTSAINRKLDDIIVPRIEFRDATIREALDFLRQRAAALDTSEEDPTRKGVNLVLKVPEDSPEANARITLALTDVPLRAAIQYVANAASLKLKVEPYAVVIVLASEPTDVLITKEYKVPPSFITALPATDASAGAAAGGGGQIEHGSWFASRHRGTLGSPSVPRSFGCHLPLLEPAPTSSPARASSSSKTPRPTSTSSTRSLKPPSRLPRRRWKSRRNSSKSLRPTSRNSVSTGWSASSPSLEEPESMVVAELRASTRRSIRTPIRSSRVPAAFRSAPIRQLADL